MASQVGSRRIRLSSGLTLNIENKMGLVVKKRDLGKALCFKVVYI